jgi:hypothetical protein
MSISGIGSSTGFDPTQMAKDFFKKADTNNDGVIDKSELKTMLSNGPNGKSMTDAQVDKIFAEIDTNGDGKIDQTENANQMKKMGAGKGGTPPSGGSGGTPKASGGGSASSSDNKVYDKRDANKDGTVSSAEQLKYDLKHPEEAQKAKASEQQSSGYTQSGGLASGSQGLFSVSA